MLLLSEADGRWSYYSAMPFGQLLDATMARARYGEACSAESRRRSVCRIAARPTARGAALGLLGVLKARSQNDPMSRLEFGWSVALRALARV